MGRKYLCRVPGCEKSLSTLGHRARHEKQYCKKGSYSRQTKYDKLPDGRLKCKNPQCLLLFVHETSFSRHLSSCGKRKSRVKKSRLSTDTAVFKDLSSDKCDDKFQRKSCLNRHVKNVHEKVYDCHMCGSTFDRIAIFERHTSERCKLKQNDSKLESVPLPFVTSKTKSSGISSVDPILQSSQYSATSTNSEKIIMDVTEKVIMDMQYQNQPETSSHSPEITDLDDNLLENHDTDYLNQETLFNCQSIDDEESFTEEFLNSPLNVEDECTDDIILKCFVDDLKKLYRPKCTNKIFTDRLFEIFGAKLGNSAFIRFLSKKMNLRTIIITNLILNYESRENRKKYH